MRQGCAESRPDSQAEQPSRHSRFVSRMQNLWALHNSDLAHIRAELAKHPRRRDLQIASGKHGRAVSVVPGARIELATPAFSGRRSTNELPRQQCSFNSLESAQRRVKFRTSAVSNSCGILCSGAPTNL